MTGQASWLSFVFVFAVLTALGLGLVYDRVLRRRFPSVRRRTVCPSAGKLVDLELAQDADSGRFLGVRSCSRQSPPDAVHCDQGCKDELQPR
jgi:hypothetical protein